MARYRLRDPIVRSRAPPVKPKDAPRWRGLDCVWAPAHTNRLPTTVSGDFEWDDAKAATNLLKHEVSFAEAALALATDPDELANFDPTHPDHVVSIVMSPRTRILVVVSTERTNRTRIVSARKADRHEQLRYETEAR